MPADLDPLDLADRRVNDGTADERRLAAALIAANKEAQRYRLALESLTPGGSEYHRNPERCVEVVREMKREPGRIVSRLRAEVERLQTQAQAIELALGAGEHLVDRSGADPRWRTLPDAVAVVVAEVERLRSLAKSCAEASEALLFGGWIMTGCPDKAAARAANVAILVHLDGQRGADCGAPVGGADWWPCALPAGHDGHHASAARLILDAHQAKR